MARTHTHAGQNLYCLDELKCRNLFVPYDVSFPLDPTVLNPNYPSNPKTFGEHLRKARLDLKLQIKEVAKLIDVDEMTIINWKIRNVKPKQESHHFEDKMLYTASAITMWPVELGWTGSGQNVSGS